MPLCSMGSSAFRVVWLADSYAFLPYPNVERISILCIFSRLFLICSPLSVREAFDYVRFLVSPCLYVLYMLLPIHPFIKD
jgi:hypothetical protein